MRKVLSTLAALFALSVPANAANRENWYYAEQPASAKLNQQQRYQRLGQGAMMQTLFGSSGGFSNLSVTAAGGLTVAVGPSTAQTVGSLYQLQVDDASAYGGGVFGPSTALAADPTQIIVQGTSTVNSSPIGPLTVPGSNSQISLIECQIFTFDSTGTATNFINSLGQNKQLTVNRDRLDTITCQAKAGTPGVSPVVPTVDTGYIGVGYVTIPSGTSTITSGMITALPAIGSVVTATNVQATGFISAGSATAATLTAGDLGASRSTTTGALVLGGSSSSCLIDYGVTTGSTVTVGCAEAATSFSGAGSGLTALNAGNISSGTLVAARGGTGQSSYTTGDVLYASGATALSKLSDVATGSVLASGGVGVAPIYTSAPTLSGANITGLPFSGVTGTVPVAQGGTNITSYTTGDIPYASGATTISKLAAVASGSVLASNGVGAAPIYTSAPAISGANLTSTSVPNSALQSSVAIYTSTTWTPTDTSGASLSLTVTSANIFHSGKSMIVSADITYPITASGTQAQISLPYSCVSGFWIWAADTNAAGTTMNAEATGNNVIFIAQPFGGGGYSNATLSTSIVRFSGSCATTT